MLVEDISILRRFQIVYWILLGMKECDLNFEKHLLQEKILLQEMIQFFCYFNVISNLYESGISALSIIIDGIGDDVNAPVASLIPK